MSAHWQATSPPGLTIVGASTNSMVSAGLNSPGGDFGGGFCWSGGGATTHDSESAAGFGPFLSAHFGFQLVCGVSKCTQPAQLDIGAISLYVRETVGPSFAAPTGLWQTSGWIRGTYQSLDTSRYGQGALPLTLSTADAAGVPASLTKTIYVDNSTPTVSITGPTDAPSTAGTQYVTATANGSPSGIADIVCTVDGSPGQTYPGPSAQVPVSGIGQHAVDCYADNNAVDPSGAHGRSTTTSRSLKIGQPTIVGIAFNKLVGLRCHRVRLRVTIPAHRRTIHRHGKRVRIRTRARSRLERVTRCHPRTVAAAPLYWCAFAATTTGSRSDGSNGCGSSSRRE